MTEWLMQRILERCKTRPKVENIRTLEKQGELKTIVQHLYAINQPDFILNTMKESIVKWYCIVL